LPHASTAHLLHLGVNARQLEEARRELCAASVGRLELELDRVLKQIGSSASWRDAPSRLGQ
jgi:hypothetical protein